MLKPLLIAGLLATMIGSFLPWTYSGDVARAAHPGIRVVAAKGLQGVEDQGGAAVLLLSVALAIAFVPRREPAEGASLWTLLDAATLVLLSAVHIADLFAQRAKVAGPEAPSAGVGLVLVAAGSLLLMGLAWRLWQRMRALPAETEPQR